MSSNDSTKMTKDEMFSKLGTKNPTGISFKILGRTLYIDLTETSIVNCNMQTNNAAFESWMLCIMAKLKGEVEIDKVILEIPTITSIQEDKKTHYNRFMYRVMKSKKHFEWFDIATKSYPIYENFVKTFNTTNFILNYPTTTAKNDVKESSEAHYERKILSTELYRGAELETKDQQLPVGVFSEKKSQSNAFFTCGHSAIDLWGIKDDSFWIFELKHKNEMVGIITELLFYMWVCEDIFINKKFKYDIQGKIPTVRSFDKIYNFAAKSIKGVMLFDEIHPLLRGDSVINFINAQFRNTPLSVYTQKFIPGPTITLL